MAKKFALVFGYLFVIIGILGFFSNPIVSDAPGAWFAVDTAHNIVHLLSGLIFLWAAYGMPEKSAKVLKIFGIVYLIIAILGFFSDTKILGLIASNTGDAWLHLVLGLIFIWGGMSKSSMAVPASPMSGQQM